MSKVFSTLSISNLFPKTTNIQAFKSIKVQNEIVVGSVKSLEEVKRPCSAAKLTTKHVLLTIVVSSNGQSTSLRQKFRVLGVHHCNISYAMPGRRLMDCNGVFMWTLYIRKRRYDV
jgi:hypothetical protein